jgi:hypothetical protein
MLGLVLFDADRRDRERNLDADVRRRQLLKALRDAPMPGAEPARSSAAPRRHATRVQATER